MMRPTGGIGTPSGARAQAACRLAKSQSPSLRALAPRQATRRCRARQPLAPRAVAQPLREEAASRNGNGAGEGEIADREERDGTCDVFVSPEGEVMEVMCCDYGFRSGFGRMYQGDDGEIPKNIFQLAWANFKKEFQQLRSSFRYNEYSQITRANPPSSPIAKAVAWTGAKVVDGLSSIDEALEAKSVLPELPQPDAPQPGAPELTQDCVEVRAALSQLKLDNAAVWAREQRRHASPEHVTAPWTIRGPYLALCWVLDVIFDGRPVQRFWFLETVARMPYFAYISMLHLYESLGWWRAGAELRRVHFAEEWNELHHLQIMEALGGDQLWLDRFLAQHAAVFYYWVLIALYAFVPTLAYQFSELVEGHAVDTYGEFVEANEGVLRTLPPPLVALRYYKGGDLYFFDALQTKGGDPRRPECRNLHDVFVNIRDDEGEHVKTMTACRDLSIVSDLVARDRAQLPDARPPTNKPGVK